MSSGFNPERFKAALMACAPNCQPDKSFSAPNNPPIGVRAIPTITIGSCATVNLLVKFIVECYQTEGNYVRDCRGAACCAPTIKSSDMFNKFSYYIERC